MNMGVGVGRTRSRLATRPCASRTVLSAQCSVLVVPFGARHRDRDCYRVALAPLIAELAPHKLILLIPCKQLTRCPYSYVAHLGSVITERSG